MKLNEHYSRIIHLLAEKAAGDPCWKGYKKVGMKMKGGRKVPNCVPGEGVPDEKSVKEGKTTGKNPTATGERVGAASKSMQFGETPTKKSPEQVKKQVTSIKDRIQKRHGDAGVGKFFGGYRSEKPRGSRAKIKEGKTPAWQRAEGKNPEGGLNAKGRASAKAQGHNLKPPVSAEQAKKSKKSAGRRKSFCARMRGMRSKLTSAKTAKDPDSRINKSLRKWDC
jgi:hypothetical protein